MLYAYIFIIHIKINFVFFRDGVGDGQLNLCAMYEIPQFQAICKNKIKITFIVVQKRNNTRFFMVSRYILNIFIITVLKTLERL